MVAHGQAHPAALTESAREARKSFYCELCNKGYGRINEFEAHEGSYDHLHKKRLKEMKAMSRDPDATSKARRAERRETEKSGLGVITIKPIASSTTKPAGGGFKKGGFKNAFGEAGAMSGVEEKMGPKDGDRMEVEEMTGKEGEAEAEEEEEGEEGEEEESEDDGLMEEERYDPTRPTGCGEWCMGRHS